MTMLLITLGLSKVIDELQVFDVKNIRLRHEQLKTKGFISKILNWLALPQILLFKGGLAAVNIFKKISRSTAPQEKSGFEKAD